MKNLDSSNQQFLDSLRSERRDLLNRLRQTRFSTLKAGYPQAQIVPYSSYSPWLEDHDFIAKYDRVKAFTLVDIYRCYELFALTRQALRLNGQMVEVGVWRGGTAALIASSAPEKVIHLFDTFEGVAKADVNHDTLYKGGEHADTNVDVVTGLFGELQLECQINVGIFPDMTGHKLPSSVAIAHIDVDTYASAKDSFWAIWPLVAPRGAIVFDDYGFFGCEGVTRAVDEIRASISDALFVHNLNGHGLLFKQA